MGDKERKSWREIDSMRDKKKSGQGRFRVHTPKTPRGYKNDLNKLFDQGEVPDRFKEVVGGLSSSGQDAERQKLIRAARDAEKPTEFNALVSQLHDSYTFPEDEDLLSRAIDHPDEEIVRSALDTLIEIDARRPLKKRAILKARLQTVMQVAKSSDTIDLAELLADRL